eukprot:3358196-Ditylum_brightwellii.AAC.1
MSRTKACMRRRDKKDPINTKAVSGTGKEGGGATDVALAFLASMVDLCTMADLTHTQPLRMRSFIFVCIVLKGLCFHLELCAREMEGRLSLGRVEFFCSLVVRFRAPMVADCLNASAISNLMTMRRS